MEKQLTSTLLYKGKIIEVYRDEVEVENGTTSIREVVRHNGGVAILAIIDGQVLLVEQYRYPNATKTLEIPAGKLEKGEDPKLCGIRELEEETGYSCKDATLLTKAFPTPGYVDEILHIYQANDIFTVENPMTGDDDEFITVVKINVEDAYNMIKSGDIVDAKTIIAIQHAYIQNKLSK